MARVSGTNPRPRPLRAVLLACLAFVPSMGCGARWTDEQRASVEARGQQGAPAAAAPGSATAAGPGGGPSAAGATVVDGAAAGGGATGGAAAGPSAGGDPAAAGGTSGPAPCTAPSEAPGVTDSEIRVGSISALSGPVPGLAASAAGAVRAYVAYRNSTGGVCGRQIVLQEADDGTDNGRYRSIVTELGPQVFGLVGGFTTGDAGGVDVVAAQALPVVNGPSTDTVADLPTVFDIFPRYEDPDAVIGKYRWLFENGATKVAIAYLGVDASRREAQLQQGLMEAAGIQVVSVQELPLSTLSYDSVARGVANSGADYLWFIADVNGEAAMARSMADTGYELAFAEYYNFPYGTNFVELAGSAAEGTVAFLRSLPNEEAAGNPEMTAFIEWMDQIATGEDLDPFAVDSWASAKLFFDTLQSLPGPITRDAFLAQLAATDTFDAGGMFGPIRVGVELTNACVIGVRYEGGAWRRIVPDSGFLC